MYLSQFILLLIFNTVFQVATEQDEPDNEETENQDTTAVATTDIGITSVLIKASGRYECPIQNVKSMANTLDFNRTVEHGDKICTWNCSPKNKHEETNEAVTEAEEVVTEKPIDIDSLDNDLKCKFQPFSYQCGDYLPSTSYSYDMQQQKCMQSLYGRCKYGYNNFDTIDKCKSMCRDIAHHPQPSNVPPIIYCRFQPSFGECTKYQPSFYYDVNEGICKGFSYSGCGGNFNRFKTSTECKLTCEGQIEYKEYK